MRCIAQMSQLHAFDLKCGGNRPEGRHSRRRDTKLPLFRRERVGKNLTMRGDAPSEWPAARRARQQLQCPRRAPIYSAPISPALQLRPLKGLPKNTPNPDMRPMRIVCMGH